MRTLVLAFISIASSLRSIATSLEIIAQHQGGLSDDQIKAVTEATAQLKQHHDALADAVAKNKQGDM